MYNTITYYARKYAVLLLLLIVIGANAQKSADTRQADRHFGRFEYYLAAEEYLELAEKDPENTYVLFRLAESFRLFFNYQRAEQYYARLLEVDAEAYPEARYRYASMMKLNSKYEAALEQFQNFLKDYEDVTDRDADLYFYKEKAKRDIQGCEMAIKEIKKPVRNYAFELVPSPVNTTASEYSPVIGDHDTALVIASSRPEATGGEQFGMLGGVFSDNFRFTKEEAGWRQQEGKDDRFNITNTRFNESPGSFTADKQKFYFTRCDEEVKVGHYTDYNCVIYVTRFDGGRWTTPEKLNENINMKGEWNSQPCVSPGGDTLFFTSKRPGGFGMHDIWYSTCNGDDNWGPAVNMGHEINTAYIDMSPYYYSKEGKLFFATNGRIGFGGLDIYITEGDGFTEPRNLGLPFNSSKDDFYFVMGETKGYLSSNRDGGLGNEDIYRFNIESAEALIAYIYEDSLKALAKKRADEELRAGRDGAEGGQGEEGEDGYAHYDDIPDRHKVQSFGVLGTMKEHETGKPAPDVTILLTDDESNVLKKMQTNEEGTFRFDNIPADKDYKVLMEDEDPRLTSEIKYIVDPAVGVNGSTAPSIRTLFENIYFDFDRHTLRPEAKKTLDELVAFYKKNSNIQIEMDANTDAIGTDEYNIGLSQRRGKAALDYLKANGVDQASLVINALGKRNPISGNKNPIGRQLNRRVEFRIVGGEGVKPYDTHTMTYIVEPQTTLYEVARRYNMTVEEIRELNDLEGEHLMAYRPLRVRRIGDSDIIDPVSMQAGNAEKRDKKFYKSEFKKAAAHNATYARLVREGKINPNLTYIPEKLKPKLNPGEAIYIAQPKNTLFRLSKLYGTTVDQLKAMNGLDSDTIYIGQIIKVPTGQVHPDASQYVVQKGDTFQSIARQHNMTADKLKAINLMEGYILQEKMILKIKE